MYKKTRDRIAEWIYANMKKDAAMTMETVIVKNDQSLPPDADIGIVRRSELYYHVSRRKQYCEVCVSLPIGELESRFEEMTWPEIVRVLRLELGNAGLLKTAALTPAAGLPGREMKNAVRGEHAASPNKLTSGKQETPSRGEEPETGEKQGAVHEESDHRKKLTAKAILSTLSDRDRALFEELIKMRAEIAAGRGIAPYVIFSNRTLAALCREKPETVEQMKTLPGIGSRNSALYGEQCIAIIRKYRNEGTQPSATAAG